MKKGKILLMGLGHGLNDCIAGFFLGSLALMKINPLQIGIGVTIYNLLAFGGQYPVAIWLEKYFYPKKFLVASYGLNVAAITVFYFSPQLAILLAGIASAVYHVTAGTACAVDKKAFHIGLFAAPGVAGLIAGGLLAWYDINITSILLVSAIIFLFVLTRTGFNTLKNEIKEPGATLKKSSIDQHDLIMILLLVVISLRSAIWDVFQLVHEKNFEWLIAIGIAAFIGKIAGGWLADKIGWRLYAIISVILATPLLSVFKKDIILFCLGIGLLQSGIPATTSLLIQSIKGSVAKGISLSFGAAIIIGASLTIFPLQVLLKQAPFILLSTFLMLVLYSLWYRRNRRVTA